MNYELKTFLICLKRGFFGNIVDITNVVFFLGSWGMNRIAEQTNQPRVTIMMQLEVWTIHTFRYQLASVIILVLQIKWKRSYTVLLIIFLRKYGCLLLVQFKYQLMLHKIGWLTF